MSEPKVPTTAEAARALADAVSVDVALDIPRERIEMMLRHSAEAIDLLRSQLAAVEQTRAKALQSALDGLTQMTEMRDREQHRATTAERERDEARREREAVQQRHDANVAGIMEAVCDLIAAEVVPKGSKSLGDAVQGALTALREARHRAERTEAVIEKAKAWRELEQLWDELASNDVVTRQERDVRFRADLALNELRVAVRALDAAEDANA